MRCLSNVEDYEVAKRWVDQWLPRSAIITQWLNVNLDRLGGYGTTKDALLYVDTWPNPNILAGVDFMQIYGAAKYPKYCFFTNFPNDASHSKLMEKFLTQLNKEISASQVGGLEVKAFDARWAPLIDKVYVENLRMKESIAHSPCSAHWLPAEERNRLRRCVIKAPEGFEFAPLTLEDAEIVDAAWPHSEEMITLSWIKRQIKHFPNVSLREATDSGRLASFEMIEAEFGLMTHLYTFQEFRRRGFASLVEKRLAQMLIERGHLPVKAVLQENEAGKAIVRASPMWKYIGDIVWSKYGNEKMAAEYLA